MDKEKFASQIIDKGGFTRHEIVKKKHGSVNPITILELLEVVWDNRTVPEMAAHFNVSGATITRLLRKTFPSLVVTGGPRTWRYALLDFIGYKECSSCEEILPHTDFYITNAPDRISNTWSECKSCNNFRRSEHFKDKPELRKAIKAKRRAAKLQATPRWANEVAIREIYAACPENCEVDHILPLQGQTVCGLHVENNLQYLSVPENRKKGNKLLPEFNS